MSERAALRTLVVLTMIVSIAAPLPAQVQTPSELEISCDAGDSLQSALEEVAAGGRLLIRSGTCAANLSITRDVRMQGSGSDRVTVKAADRTLPVIAVPRGVAATISGVSIESGRIGVLSTGRVALAFATVTGNASGGIELRDGRRSMPTR